jgi:hypothetical protein
MSDALSVNKQGENIVGVARWLKSPPLHYLTLPVPLTLPVQQQTSPVRSTQQENEVFQEQRGEALEVVEGLLVDQANTLMESVEVDLETSRRVRPYYHL